MANVISVSVLGDVKDISRKMGSIEKQVGGLGSKFTGLAKLIGGAFAVSAVVDFFSGAITGAEDAAAKTKVLNKVFESMGGTSSQAFKDLTKQSDSLSRSLAVDDDVIKGVQTKLGTFKNIWNDPIKGAQNFERATTIAFDLAAAGFGTADTNAIQLGKALQDPTKGMTALAKSGVTFTDAEKEKIKALQKSGDLVGAQEIVYKALENQVGGAAKANVKASQKMKVAFDEVVESVGTALLPAFTKVADFVVGTLLPKFDTFVGWFQGTALPAIKTFASEWADRLQPAFKTVGDFLTGTLVPRLQELVQAFKDNQAWIMPIVVGITALVAAYKTYQTILTIGKAINTAFATTQAALNLVMSANPIALVVIAIVALIAALVYAYKTNETFRAIVDKVWNAIKGVVAGVINWFTVSVPAAWESVKAKTSSIFNAVKDFIVGVFNSIKSWISNSLSSIKGTWESVWNAVKSFVVTIWNGIKTSISGAIGGVVSIVAGIKDKVVGAVSGAATWLVQTGKNLIQGLINGIGSMSQWIKDKIGSVINGAISWAKNILGIASPSKVFKKIGSQVGQGLVIGLDSMNKKVTKAGAGLAGAVADGFSAPRMTLNARTSSLTPLGAGAGSNVQISVNVPPTADKAAIGREIKSALDEWQRVSG